jgi:hypothetical protein
MTVRIPKLCPKKTCFVLAYAIYFIARYMEYTSIISYNGAETVIDYIKIVTYCIFAILIILRNRINILKNGKYALFILAVLAIAVYQIFLGRGNSIFVIALIGLAYFNVFKDGEIDRFIQANLSLNILMFATVVILNAFKILPNVNTSMLKFGNITFNRSSLGFVYPGQLQIACLTLVTLMTYVTKDKNSRLFKIFSFTLSTVIFMYSQTIMPYLMTLLAIMIIQNEETLILKKRVFLHSATFCFIITIILVILKYFNISAANEIDVLLNYRLSLSVTAIRKYGITMLGTFFRNINEGGPTGEYLYLDSEYMYILISNGIIYSIFSLIILKILNAFMFRTNKFAAYSVLIVWYINGIVNSGIFNVLFNPLIICIFPAIKNYFIKIKGTEVINGKNRDYPG